VSQTALLAGACAVLLSVALVCMRRTAAALHVCALQALLAAVALELRGWGPIAAALLAFALIGVVALPLALRRLADRHNMSPVIAMRYGVVASWLAALFLLLITAATFTQLKLGDATEVLALGASVMLLGVLLVVQQSHPMAPALGLLSSQNGLILVASAIPDLPLATTLVVAVPLIPALLAVNVWLRP
jgi:hydrogenase-4 membrane subunit HyfE